MSTEIEFYKSYTRSSRSPWDDRGRYCIFFLPQSKHGIYLHVGECGFNGISVSRELQQRLPEKMQRQYICSAYLDVILHVFKKELEEYCNTQIKLYEFKDSFLLSQQSFFSETAKSDWEKSYNQYLASL